MRLSFSLLLLFFTLFACQSWGQQTALSNQRCLWVSGERLTVPFQPDSLSLAAKTLQITSIVPSDFPADSLQWSYDPNTNLLQWQGAAQRKTLPDSVQICFRVYPFRWEATHFLYLQKTETAHPDSTPILNYYPSSAALEKEELFKTDGLYKNGSLVRGLSFGNTQNVFVNSALNLQIEGPLTDDIYLTAAISDQQVPFQPEGNTQQIQDFDRVYLELKHQQALLRAGDVTLQNDSSSYFLRYYKNVQGAQAEAYWGKPGSPQKAITQLGASLARGQFRTQMLTPLEGVLGPYRLSGNNNERFIIVMANSEQVWLDGKLLQRGFQNDYTIDYNQAEITFTPNALITRFSRLRVDFEFATQEYSRSITQADHQHQFKKGTAYVNFYREKDNENAPLGFEPGEEELTALQNAGDRPRAAFTVPIDTLERFSADQILYTLKDTLANGQTFSVYERAVPESAAFYQLSFTEVGQGNGDYILDTSTTNGRVFRWVAPEGNQRQGRYTPGRPITAPNLRQMITTGGKYEVGKHGFVHGEMAFSNHDLNLLSSLDDADNQGQAFTLGYQNTGTPLGGSDWELYGGGQVEFDQRNFQVIDRFRAVAFDRDWSLNLDSLGQQTDRIGQGKIGLRQRNERQQVIHDIGWRSVYRDRDVGVKGWQHFAYWQSNFRFLRIKADGLNLRAQLPSESGTGLNTTWQRANFSVSAPLRKFVPGYSFYLDQNKVSSAETGEVVRSAMHAQAHTLFVENGDSLSWKFRTDFTLREDQTPQAGEMKASFSSQTFNLKAEKTWQQNRFASTLTLREQQNELLPKSEPEQTINGRIDWRQNIWQKNIRSEITWQTSASQELRREFVFVRAATGLGTHTWRDDNGDGIQDLNEFYEALNPDERNYVKYFTPTDEYVPAFSSLYNHRLRFQFPVTWLQSESWKQWAGKLSGQVAFVAERKTNASEWQRRFLPFGNSLETTELLSERTNFRSNLFFNQRNPKWGAGWQFLQNARTQLLTNGFESRNRTENQFNARWNIGQQFSIETKWITARLGNNSDWLVERNFAVESNEIAPEIAWQPSSAFRLSAAVSYRSKLGKAEAEITDTTAVSSENLKATIREATLKLRWVQAASRSLNAEWQITSISFDEETNTPVAYELLEALQPGQNLRWQVFFTQKLFKGLQLNVNYNGRKSGDRAIIHLGQMQLTALF